MIKYYYLMRKLYKLNIPIFPTIIRKIIRLIYSCEIHPTSEVGDNVDFVHGGLGCVIHERCVIESNVKIYQNVTIGGNGKINQQFAGVPRICEGG